MRLKHSSMSAFANESGWSTGTGASFSIHSSMPQKWAWCSFTSRALTILATRGNCSVGPIGPQMPTGSSAVACCQTRTYSSASAQVNSSSVS